MINNSLKTVFFMTLLTVLLVLAGNLIGGQMGMIFALVLAIAMNFGSYWFSDKIVLKMYRAQEIDRSSAPQLFDMVAELAQRASLPMPRIYVINDQTPNAFATGRNPDHAAVAVTTGITRLLTTEELAGVMAHELAHIKNRDILIGTIAATFAGAITLLANMAQWALIFGGRSSDDDNGGIIGSLLMIFLAPIAATLVQMAVSRSREYVADADGAKIARNPLALASALGKLSQMNAIKPVDHATPNTAHMFIVSPLLGGGLAKLFSTHPPIEERISRLKAIANGRA
ncbi:MAG: zinc metalloprotease HtpX [Ignavibacteriaceae bacterium]|nr:zinc metalloprotease HtpX [Ignavibacteriaceae bacterium]